MSDEALRKKKLAVLEEQKAFAKYLTDDYGVNAAVDIKYPGRLEICVENNPIPSEVLGELAGGYSLHYAYHDSVDEASIVVFELDDWDGKEEYEKQEDEEWEDDS